MKSKNFEFIRSSLGPLADSGALAELYAYPDPAGCLVKLRTMVEVLVAAIYDDDRLERPYQWGLNDLMNHSAFANNLPSVILDKMHLVRKLGNKAAHGQNVHVRDALIALEAIFDATRWFYVIYLDGARQDVPDFQPPPKTKGLVSETESKREHERLLRNVAAKEQALERALEQLEALRATQTKVAKDNERLQAQLARGVELAQSWNMNEAQTRKQLIDLQLADAGWDVGDSQQVGLEVMVDGQPTSSKTGYVDYVLWGDDGSALAVIEAKRYSTEPSRGRKQATLYADALQAKYGQRPVIYCTNGAQTEFWDDAQGYPPRDVAGFHSKESLLENRFQREHKRALSTVELDSSIAGRLYQMGAVKQILERLDAKHRTALMVMATGTGKTRTAMSLSSALMDARWAKRVLFLCDRRELRKQAFQAFQEHLPHEPRVIVQADTARDRDKRVYLATYPAMMKHYRDFDVGFFDLIIADESHRSVYNIYKSLFDYFDAIRVGLTATPVKFINRNTYRLFGCENEDPTAHYSYEDALRDSPPYLVPFQVVSHTTKFLREGIKYSQMNEAQRRELEDGEMLPELVEYEAKEVDSKVFNKDTNKRLLRNLMDRGIRDGSGQQVGKTIVFARNHAHAVLLEQLFNEMYPQYGGRFCQVIDYHNPRAEQLIDDFKGTGTNDELTIAISVDMLDTGIDVPEIVNLVFAKPVRSHTKFWQMIGRGTRLCPDLFGPGQDKSEFLIFDHWNNFQFFDEQHPEVDPPRRKSLMERLFEVHVALAREAQSEYERAYTFATEQILGDLRALPLDSIEVRQHALTLQPFMESEDVLKNLDDRMIRLLEGELASLMQWRPLNKQSDAYDFDLLIAHLQLELLRGSNKAADYRADLEQVLGELPTNLNQVHAKRDIIDNILSASFWNDRPQVDIVLDLENARETLRGLMQYRQKATSPRQNAIVLDLKEDSDAEERKQVHVPLKGLELTVYRNRVHDVLTPLFDSSPALQKIRSGQAISPDEFKTLQALVLEQDPDLDLGVLRVFYPEFADNLSQVLQSIVGLDAKVVEEVFAEFVQEHPGLHSRQVKFLEMLKNHIGRYGSLKLEQLYDAPFTTLAPEGIEGIFEEDVIDKIGELLDVVSVSLH